MQDLGCMIDHIRYTMYDVQTTLNLNIEHWRLLIIIQYQYPATSIRNLNLRRCEDAKDAGNFLQDEAATRDLRPCRSS